MIRLELLLKLCEFIYINNKNNNSKKSFPYYSRILLKFHNHQQQQQIHYNKTTKETDFNII